MSFVLIEKIAASPEEIALREAQKKKSDERGGSCYVKLVAGFPRTILTVSKGFQKTHKIDKCDHVVIKFNPKTKVVQLSFEKKEVPKVSRKIARSCGTAYIQIASTFNKYKLALVKNLYRDEYVFKDGKIYVDLSDNLGPKPKRVVSMPGRNNKYSKKDAAKVQKAKENLVQNALEEGLKARLEKAESA